jgi:hypothetical protein
MSFAGQENPRKKCRVYAVSQRFLDAIRRGTTPVTRVDISFPGQGIVYSDLPVSAGNMTISRNNIYRGSGSLTIPDPTLAPVLTEDSPLNPYGYELIIKTGFIYHNTTELIPMGVFPIEDAEVGEDGVTNITFFDRAKSVERSDFIAPKDYSGWFAHFALEDVIMYAAPFYPGPLVEWSMQIDPELEGNDPPLPGGTVLDGARWQFVEEICQACGAEAYFDRDGNAQIVPVPGINEDTPITEVAWEVDTGPNGVLIRSSRKVSRTGVFNAVVVVGSGNSTGAPPFAFVFDSDSNSRTYYEGPFGKSVKRISNSLLTQEGDCEIAAQAELKNMTGLQRTISFNSLRNPALDPGDIILIKHLDGTSNLVMLDSYQFDFATGDMDGTIRSIQYVG